MFLLLILQLIKILIHILIKILLKIKIIPSNLHFSIDIPPNKIFNPMLNPNILLINLITLLKIIIITLIKKRNSFQLEKVIISSPKEFQILFLHKSKEKVISLQNNKTINILEVQYFKINV